MPTYTTNQNGQQGNAIIPTNTGVYDAKTGATNQSFLTPSGKVVQQPMAPTNFSTPAPKTVNPPAVHTATAATNDVNNMQTQSTNNAANITQHQAAVAATPPATNTTDTSKPAANSIDTSNTDLANSVRDQIMSSFGDTSRTDAATTAGNTQISNDQAQLDFNDKLLNGDPNATTDAGKKGLLQMSNDVSDSLAAMANGSAPLTDAQKMQVTDLGNQYKTVIANAVRYAQNVQGGAAVRSMLSGAVQYTPGQAASDMANAIATGQTKIAKANSDMIDAQNKLSTALNDQNYKAATQYFNKIQTGITQVNRAIDQANADISKVQTKLDQAQKDHMTAIMDMNTITHDQKMEELQQSQLDEKTKNDLANIAIKNETLRLKQIAGTAAAGTNAVSNTPIVQTSTDGTPDPTSQAQFLATLPGGANGDAAAQIKGLADYTIDPSTFATRQLKGGVSMDRATAIGLAKKYDPSYNEAQYTARKNYLNKLDTQTGTALGSTIVSGNKVLNHLAMYADAMYAMNNGGFSSGVNALTQGIRSAGNGKLQESIKSAQGAKTVIGTELAKFLKGTGSADIPGTEANIMQFDEHSTPSEVKGALKTAITTMLGQLDPLIANYQTVMGKPPPAGTFITPEALANMERLNNINNLGLDLTPYMPTNYGGVDISGAGGVAPQTGSTVNGFNLPN